MRRAGALLALAFAACGGSALKKADASVDGGGIDARADVVADTAVDGSADAPPAGFRVYDVTATLTLDLSTTSVGGDFSSFPTTASLTFVWNPGAQQGVSGSDGRFSLARVTTTDNRTFQASGLMATASFASSCTGAGVVSLSQVSFTLDGGTLHGTAVAEVTYATSSAPFFVLGKAVLAGAPRVTGPAFTSPGTNVDPLAPLVLRSSEPLPVSVAASLVSSPSGDTIALDGMAFSVASSARAALQTGGRVLRYGETYTMAAGQVVDYAGNKTTAPVSFTTRATPPLLPPDDGFESVTGTMFAGAGVLSGGPLTPIAGKTSLLLNTGYGGGFGFLPYDLGSSLAVRLAVPAGATKVSFDAQLIAPDPTDGGTFVGEVRFGSVGGSVVVQENVSGSGFTKQTLPELGDIYVSPVQTITLPLPADATGEIAFEIVGEIDLCAQPPSPTVLVVDNLRVE